MVQGGWHPEPSPEVDVSGPCLHLCFITCCLCPVEVWTAQSFLLRVPLLLVCGPTLNAISSYKPSLAFQAKASDSLLVLKLRCLQAPSLSLSKLIFIVFKGSVAVLLLECKQQKSRVPMSAIWLLSVTICLVGNCRGRTASQVFSFMVSQFVSCRMGILLVVAVTN